jgi:hypothetical protein
VQKRFSFVSVVCGVNGLKILPAAWVFFGKSLRFPHLTPSNTLPRPRTPAPSTGPGGPAQLSRLHRHASCLTCATSPHPTPSRAPAPPHRRTRSYGSPPTIFYISCLEPIPQRYAGHSLFITDHRDFGVRRLSPVRGLGR